jgi:CheY-like chemotaxis protein
MSSVLIADDDIQMRTLLAVSLRQSGFDVAYASAHAELLALAGELAAAGRPPSAVVIDLSVGDGTELIEALRRLLPAVPILVVTAFRPSELCQRAFAAGAAAVLPKPFDVATLRQALWSSTMARRQADSQPS